MTADENILRHRNNARWAKVAAFTWPAALVCAALAASIGAATWAEWFTHPLTGKAVDHLPGARLLRIMLGVLAGALVAWPVVMHTIGGAASAGRLKETAKGARQSPQANTRSTSLSISRAQSWSLIGFVCLALVPRLARFNESLWYDEIASWVSYGVGVTTPGPIVGNYYDPVNHVFHTLLSWCSVTALEGPLGIELALRLPALLFSLLSIPIMYGLANEAAGPRAGVVAAFLAAMLPASVLEGVEARGYSMMICFSALATWMLLRAVRGGQAWNWLAYAVTCTLGIWSQFVTVFLVFGHAAWITVRTLRTRDWRVFLQAAAAMTLAAVATLTLVAPLLPEFFGNRDVFVASRGNEPTALGAEGFHALLQLGGSWAWWAALPGLGLAALGCAVAVRSAATGDGGRPSSGPRQFDWSLPTAMAAMIGLPLFLLAITVGGSWMYARFTFFALPGAILLMAVGISALWRWKSKAGLAAMAVVTGAAVADLVTRPPKQPLRDAMLYVFDHEPGGELRPPAVHVLGLAHQVLRMYQGDAHMTYSLRHGEGILAGRESLVEPWVIVEYPRSVSREMYGLLSERGYTEVARFHGWVDWINGDVVVYRRSD